ncbi:hypothetical protein MMC29_001443 [Sticta canariensis]|nr:hypothetical protein [Sticta canariensis]
MGSHLRLSKPALMKTLTLCFGIFLLFRSTALASPLVENSISSRGLERRYDQTNISPKFGDTGPATSDYPSDDEINAAFIAPAGPFVFFPVCPTPKQFAQTMQDATILRMAYPKSYVNQRFKPNPARSIEWYQNFLDRLSGIYADKAVAAGRTVYFVGDYDGTVRDCSIWRRVELPTLLAGGISIKLVDYGNFSNQKDYTVPDLIISRDVDGALEKRETDYCFDWPGDDDDADDPDIDPTFGIPCYSGSCGMHLQQVSRALLTKYEDGG